MNSENKMIFKMILINAYKDGDEKVPYGLKKILNEQLKSGDFAPLYEIFADSEETFIHIVKDFDVIFPPEFFIKNISAEHLKNYIYYHFDYISVAESNQLFNILIDKKSYYAERYLTDLIIRYFNFNKKLYNDVAKNYIHFITSYDMQIELLKNGIVSVTQCEACVLSENCKPIDAFKMAVYKLVNFRGVGNTGIETELQILQSSTQENDNKYAETLIKLCGLVKEARQALMQGQSIASISNDISRLYGIGASQFIINNQIYESFLYNKVYPKPDVKNVVYDDESTEDFKLD